MDHIIIIITNYLGHYLVHSIITPCCSHTSLVRKKALRVAAEKGELLDD